MPPFSKPNTLPPPLNLLEDSPRGIEVKKLPMPRLILIAIMAVRSGITGVKASPIFIKAEAKFSAVLTNSWKPRLSVTPLTKARNSSFTLVIRIASACCAVTAFCVKPLPAF